MTNRAVEVSLHVNAQGVCSYVHDFGSHTSYGIGFSETNFKSSDEDWYFDRRSDDGGRVCTVRDAAEEMVYDGIESFEMSRTGIVCEFDPETAERVGLRHLTIAYQIDDACWADLLSHAQLVFAGMAYFKLASTPAAISPR